MAKQRASQSSPDTKAKNSKKEEEIQQEQEDEQDEPIEVYDGPLTKRTLDETISEIITEDAKYPESYYHSNTKLGLMTIACLVGAFAQFYPASQPNSRTVYLGGAALFTCITVIIQLLYLIVDGEYFLFTLGHQGTGTKLKLRSKMPNYSDKYKCIIEAGSSSVELSQSITRYFSASGSIDRNLLRKDVLALVKELERKQN